MVSQQKKILIICDFDGTVCTVDLGNEIINKFTTSSLKDIERDYVKGKIGSRIAYEKIAKRLQGSRKKMLDFILAAEKLDPYFLKFYAQTRKKGFDVIIVSDGLDLYIEAILKKYKLTEIKYYSNLAVFDDNNALSIEFPEINELCGRCGTCKNNILNSHRLLYDKIIYIGDGYSDFCPSRYADLVFGKKILFEKCERDGISCLQFKNFNQINKYLTDNY